METTEEGFFIIEKHTKWGETPRMRCDAVLAIALCSFLAAGCGSRTEVPPPSIERVKAPEFTLKRVDGLKIMSEALKGKVVVVNFWTTWSPPSAREIPELIDLQKYFEKKGEDVQFVGISLDEKELKDLKQSLERLGFNYPVGLGDPSLISKFGGIDAIPSTFIIEPDGFMVNRYTGAVDKDVLKADIETRLKRWKEKQKEG